MQIKRSMKILILWAFIPCILYSDSIKFKDSLYITPSKYSSLNHMEVVNNDLLYIQAKHGLFIVSSKSLKIIYKIPLPTVDSLVEFKIIDNRLYLLMYKKLLIYDISNPKTPKYISFLVFNNEVEDMEIFEQQAKLTVYSGNRYKLIIDIKNEKKPFLVNRLTNEYGQYSRYIFNKNREIFLMNKAFYIVDISLLHRPKKFSFIHVIKKESPEIALEDIVFSKNKEYIYAITGEGVIAYNIKNLKTPIKVADFYYEDSEPYAFMPFKNGIAGSFDLVNLFFIQKDNKNFHFSQMTLNIEIIKMKELDQNHLLVLGSDSKQTYLLLINASNTKKPYVSEEILMPNIDFGVIYNVTSFNGKIFLFTEKGLKFFEYKMEK